MVDEAAMEFSESEEDLIEYLESVGADYHKEFMGNNIYYVVNDEYIVEFMDRVYPEAVYEKQDFMYQRVAQGSGFFELTGIDYRKQYNEKFWSRVGEVHNLNDLFHATQESDVEEIMNSKLKVTRGSGVTNTRVRGVFTVLRPQRLFDGTYGSVILKIDTVKMKRNGFTPLVSKEPEYEDYFKQKVVAEKLNLSWGPQNKPSVSTGMWEETRVIHESVPNDYLSVFERL